MTRLPDPALLGTLARVHELRTVRARRLVLEQQLEVDASRAELAERRAVVAAMQRSLEANRRYMRSPEVAADPAKLEAAFRYRRWVEYDMERAVYYVELTEEELEEHLAELGRRERELARVRAKGEATDRLRAKVRVRRDVLGELALEDELDGVVGTGGRGLG